MHPPFHVSRRRALAGLAGIACAAWPWRTSWAQNAARDSARFVFGFPGGAADALCRQIAAGFDGYARSVIVENKTGAGGQLAVAAVKAATADGGTLLFTPASVLALYPHTYRKLPYDPFTDFMPVGIAAQMTFALAVGPMVPGSVLTVRDFAAWCKANPGSASYGSPAAGSAPHFIGIQLQQLVQVDLRHVPYRGTQPAIIDLIGGQLASAIGPIGEFLPHAKAGKLRVLATSGARRSPYMPETASFDEQGFPTLRVREWLGFFAPAGTPPETVAAANQALRSALARPSVQDMAALSAFEIEPSGADDLARLLRADHARWAPIVRQSGFSAES